MTTHIVDRRLNPQGKSLSNRQRFLKRAKDQVRKAVHKESASRGIEEVMKGGNVSIPLDGIEEPFFHHGSGGIHDRVLPGNKKFVEGDILPRQGSSGGKGGSDAGEGDSVDAFRFILTREEFLDLFFDDLALPDLTKRKLIETESEGLNRAGYSVAGSPANIAYSRSSKIALMRRKALRRPTKKQLEEQREKLRLAGLTDDDAIWYWEQTILAKLEKRVKRIPWIDTKDIRYRRFEPKPKPNSQAVMFCLMDVSGSMSEHMKDLAKRFYMLLYVFLRRNYRHVELVFIRHTDRAEEVDEKTFFYDPASGGTLVSSALEEMKRVIKARFNPFDWNIYAAQASDGDNSSNDEAAVTQLMLKDILPLTQYFAYLEVGDSNSGFLGSSESSLWQTYRRIKSDKLPLVIRKVKERSEIYPVFRELFEKRMSGE